MRNGFHVTHLADYGGPYAGSFIPLLQALSRACDRRGHTLRLVFPRRAAGRPWLTDLAGTDVILAGHEELRRRPELIRPPAGTNRRAVVHTHFTRYDVPAALAARRQRRTIVFWHIHTGPLDPDARRIASARVRARNTVRFGVLGRSVAGILCVAPHMVADLRARLAPAGKLAFFPNGLDLDLVPVATPASRAAARTSLGLAADTEVVLHFGRNWAVKGGDVLVAAAARLSSTRERLVVVTLRGGDAAAADARRCGLEGVVRPVAGLDRIADAYAAADVLAAPSRTEGMPFTVLEALSSGVPVVASDIPGHAALAGALPGLRLVPVEDPRSLAEALALALDEPHDAELAARARAWVEEHAGVDAWADRLLDLYETTFAAAE